MAETITIPITFAGSPSAEIEIAEGASSASGYSGTSGYSGFSGDNEGSSGYSGYSGEGSSGYSGYSGNDGSAGTSGYSGYSGNDGTSGYSGFSGISGYSGYSGISGYSGYSGLGTSGYSGYSGVTADATTICYMIDGGGAAITTGLKGFVIVDFACTIVSASLLLDQSSTTTIDIWKDTYGNFPPDNGDTITGANELKTSAAVKDQDETLTSWTTSISAGDVLAFNVDANNNATRATISLRVTR